jgi:4-amino-4-deoxy-L-arabinose transferase-like glycosyltransferase
MCCNNTDDYWIYPSQESSHFVPQTVCESVYGVFDMLLKGFLCLAFIQYLYSLVRGYCLGLSRLGTGVIGLMCYLVGIYLKKYK